MMSGWGGVAPPHNSASLLVLPVQFALSPDLPIAIADLGKRSTDMESEATRSGLQIVHRLSAAERRSSRIHVEVSGRNAFYAVLF